MEKTKGCPCGRSPTGVCIGWHALSEENKKSNPFNHRAIDGLGE